MTPQRHHSDSVSARPGFSLIEMLVVIAIIALLIGILIPTLAGARRAARQTQSTANLRSIAGILDLYTQTYKDTFPYASGSDMYDSYCDGLRQNFGSVWATEVHWPLLMHQLAPWTENLDMYLSPGADRAKDSCMFPSSYTYSTSFLARPAYWDPVSPDLAGGNAPTRIYDVLYASSKVIMWDSELPYLHRELKMNGPDVAESTPMLFVDGHAKVLIPSEATPAVPSIGDQRLHNTPDGVRGRDY